MSQSYHSALGRRVVSRATAHELGSVDHLLATVDGRAIAAVIMGRGKKAQLVDWAQLSGFGADAVMVSDEQALRSATGDREERAAAGKLDLLGTRVLSELGNSLGVIEDLIFDETNGAVEAVVVSGRQLPAQAVLSAGSYAVVVADVHDPT